MALVAYRSAMGSQRAPAEVARVAGGRRDSRKESPSEAVKSIEPRKKRKTLARPHQTWRTSGRRHPARATSVARPRATGSGSAPTPATPLATLRKFRRGLPSDFLPPAPLSLSLLRITPVFSKERESKSRVESPSVARRVARKTATRATSGPDGTAERPGSPNKTGAKLALQRFRRESPPPTVSPTLSIISLREMAATNAATAARWQSR